MKFNTTAPKTLHRKKVLFFLGSLTSGGAERVVASLSGYLACKDYEVVIVTVQPVEKDFFKLNDQVKRDSLDLGQATYGLKSIFATIKRIYRLRLKIRMERPDVVIGMMTVYSLFVLIASIGLRHKTIISERSNVEKKTYPWYWEVLRRKLYGYAGAIVVQTKVAETFITPFAKRSIVAVIPNSVKWPLNSHPPVVDPALYLNEGDKLISAIGRLEIVKGFDLLIKALEMAKSDLQDTKVVILGEGGKRRDLELQIESAGLKDKVFLPGKVGNIKEWLVRSDVFVLSSRHEGYPNALLEAMAAGCACVSFDCDTGPSEIIRNGENGILVEKENIESLCIQIARLIRSDKFREELSQRSIEVRKTFSEEIIFEKWLRLIEFLLSGKQVVQ